jgi:hypothetical protein
MDSVLRVIMEAVIKARSDKADLTGKSDDYVTARFDGVMEAVDVAGNGAKAQAALLGPRADAAPGATAINHDAYQERVKRMQSAWMGDSNKGAA